MIFLLSLTVCINQGVNEMNKVLLIPMAIMVFLLIVSQLNLEKEEERSLISIGPKIQNMNGELLINELEAGANSNELYVINYFLEGIRLKIKRDGTIFLMDWEIYIKGKDENNYIRLDSNSDQLLMPPSTDQTIVYNHEPLFPLRRVVKAIENAPWELILKELPGDEKQSFELWLRTSYVKGESVNPHPFSNDAAYLIVESNNKLRIEGDYSKINITNDRLDFFIYGEDAINLLIDY